MSELPKGWATTNLNNISLIVTGKTPSKKNVTFFNGPIPFIKPGDINNQGAIKNTSESLSLEGANTVPHVPKNSIVVTCIGNLGRVAITSTKSATNQQINSVIPFEPINVKYLYYYLQTIKNWMEDNSSATTITIINKTRFSLAPVLIAPLNEQIRIANKLDSLLGKLEATQKHLDKIPTLLKRFRQSVLAAAVSGELTVNWREGLDLKHKLKDLEKLKLKLIDEKKVKKGLVFEIVEDLHAFPKSWKTITLGSIATKVTDGEHKTPKREKSGKYLLSARNVRDGYISVDNVDYVGDEEFEKLRKRCNPDKGDILISCSGSVGRISLVDKSDAYVMVRSAALVKTEEMKQNNKYLMYVLQSPRIQRVIEEKSRATAQSNLFLGPIKQLPIPYPTFEEQKQIVHQVESLFNLADKVEQQYQAAKQSTDKLTQSILAKAFRGELVPQDPNDEPASELLKRIQVNKA